jgi:PAS domain-containing protein
MEFPRITDARPQAITLLGPHGNVLYANRAAQEYTGLTLVSRVRSSRNACDVLKRPTILTGLGRHPYSSKRALKEVCHAVKASIWAKLSLVFCPGEDAH